MDDIKNLNDLFKEVYADKISALIGEDVFIFETAEEKNFRIKKEQWDKELKEILDESI